VSDGRARLSARFGSTDWFSARHPSSGALQAAAAGSHGAYRLQIPAGCVKYFTHSREFHELNDGVRADLGVILATLHGRGARPRRDRIAVPMDGRLRFCGNFKSISRDAGTSFVGLTLWLHKRARCEARRDRCAHLCRRQFEVMFGEEGAVRSYRITLRDRETQTVVGYYDGSWTTDGRRALDLRKREVAEAHAAHMRERCPRNADLIKVEELDAAD
jgi:hypothetical protein